MAWSPMTFTEGTEPEWQEPKVGPQNDPNRDLEIWGHQECKRAPVCPVTIFNKNVAVCHFVFPRLHKMEALPSS